MSFSRRQMLQLGFGAVAASTFGQLPQFAFGGDKQIPLCLQMYSVRKDFHANPAKVMAEVAKMGYNGVEYAGYPCSVKELRKLQDDNGLFCNGSHIGRQEIENPDILKQTIENHLTLGAKYLICSWMQNNSVQDWVEAAKKFSAAAEVAAEHGLYVGYHAHGHDFNIIDGKLSSWEVFANNSSSKVQLQMDTSNCPTDPYTMVEKYPGRGRTIHLKETGNKVIGEGTIDWKRFFRICETVGGVDTYTIEYEASGDSLAGCADCEKAYRRIHG